MDLLLYRQLCSPILTQAPVVRQEPSVEELSRLFVASSLAPVEGSDAVLPAEFTHPSGVEVTVSDADLRDGLLRLLPRFPAASSVAEAFASPAAVQGDLRLLHRNGLVALRLREPAEAGDADEPLHCLEAAHGGYRTSALHVCERG
jgi:hypothetical protein